MSGGETLPAAIREAQDQVDADKAAVEHLASLLKAARKLLRKSTARRDRILEGWNKSLPLLDDSGVLAATDGAKPDRLQRTA